MPPIPPIVSVADHIVEPAHVWRHWLPPRYRDHGPHVVRRRLGGLRHLGGTAYAYDIDPADGSGRWCDMWVYDGRVHPLRGHVAAAGRGGDESAPGPITYDEMRPGCHDPAARVVDLRADHVDRSLGFPTFPGPCGQLFLHARDRDVAFACVRAYNDWMIEEWCADSDRTLVPLGIVPLWNAHLAAAEVRRNAERGCRAVSFPGLPPGLGLASIHSGRWEPFIAACETTGTTICMHIGSSTPMRATRHRVPKGVTGTLSSNSAMASLTDWLFSGILPRHTQLAIAYNEGQIGWLPYVLERADAVWDRARAYTDTRVRVPEPPSTYWYHHGFGCFSRDRHGLDSIDRIGADNVAFETHYPRVDSSWPHTLEMVEKMFADLDQETTDAILRSNGLRMLGLA